MVNLASEAIPGQLGSMSADPLFQACFNNKYTCTKGIHFERKHVHSELLCCRILPGYTGRALQLLMARVTTINNTTKHMQQV